MGTFPGVGARSARVSHFELEESYHRQQRYRVVDDVQYGIAAPADHKRGYPDGVHDIKRHPAARHTWGGKRVRLARLGGKGMGNDVEDHTNDSNKHSRMIVYGGSTIVEVIVNGERGENHDLERGGCAEGEISKQSTISMPPCAFFDIERLSPPQRWRATTRRRDLLAHIVSSLPQVSRNSRCPRKRLRWSCE